MLETTLKNEYWIIFTSPKGDDNLKKAYIINAKPIHLSLCSESIIILTWPLYDDVYEYYVLLYFYLVFRCYIL